MKQKQNFEDPGVMSLGLFALVAFLLVGAVAAILGRDAGVDPDPMPFAVPDTAQERMDEEAAAAEPERMGTLPAEITESSGIAHSRHDPDVWYTHNDGPDGRVFAIRSDGTPVGTWGLGDIRPVDIEDIAAAPCPDGAGASCLYLADTGDNDRDRDGYAVYVVREPDLLAGDREGRALELVAVQRFTYGGDSRDAEALAVLPDGSMIVITKGQEEGAEMFRLPPLRRTLPGAPTRTQTAESLGMLPIDVDRKRNRVTAAAVSPSGRRLAVRSDVDVTLFELPGRSVIRRCEFAGIGQQGEAVDFLDETTLVMTFEARGGGAPIVRARCGD